jgi:hypothetical protein
MIAVGTGPTYAASPLSPGRHRVVIDSEWTEATVRVDGLLVWKGDPLWSRLSGAYPVLHLGPGQHRFSVVPAVDISLAAGIPAQRGAFEEAFAQDALHGQAPDGRVSDDSPADAWTALALVLQHRRTQAPEVAAALDRWAAGRVAAAPAGGSWPGPTGSASIRTNLGEPGIPLALWAKDRESESWARTVSAMIEASGFTGCDGDGRDWCRLGNLQPDGTVIRAGQPGAAAALLDFQFAETAGFITGTDMPSRRSWIRSLPERVYWRTPCQPVELLGPLRHQSDLRPWSAGARASYPGVLFLLGLAYLEAPDDPVWSDPAVRSLITCSMTLLQSQAAGPMGWRTDDAHTHVAIGSQDVAASKLLAPIVGRAIDPARFAAAWESQIDPQTLRARAEPDEPAGSADYRTAVSAVMLAIVDGS